MTNESFERAQVIKKNIKNYKVNIKELLNIHSNGLVVKEISFECHHEDVNIYDPDQSILIAVISAMKSHVKELDEEFDDLGTDERD